MVKIKSSYSQFFQKYKNILSYLKVSKNRGFMIYQDIVSSKKQRYSLSDFLPYAIVGRNPDNYFVGYWEKRCLHKVISVFTDLYDELFTIFINSAPYNSRIVVILIPAPKVLLWCADKGSSFNSSQPTSVILILVSKREANCQCTPDTSPPPTFFCTTHRIWRYVKLNFYI